MQVPSAYKNIGLMHVAGGILAAVTSLLWVVSFMIFCVGFLWVVPMAMAGMQAYLGYRMSQGDRPTNPMLLTGLGVGAGVLAMNPIPIVIAAFAWHQLNQEPAKAYLEGREPSLLP